jgi:hypothetical protein
MDPESLSDVAKPIAHLADRSKLGKKYGRVIIDSSDGIIAMIQIGMWGSRVNRIARRYREGSNDRANVIDIQGRTTGSDVSEQPVPSDGLAGYRVNQVAPNPAGGFN